MKRQPIMSAREVPFFYSVVERINCTHTLKCKRCGKEVITTVKNTKYCGSGPLGTGCAYEVVKAKARARREKERLRIKKGEANDDNR